MRSDVSGGVVHPRAAKDQLAQAVVSRFIHADAAAEAAAEFTRVFAEKEPCRTISLRSSSGR